MDITANEGNLVGKPPEWIYGENADTSQEIAPGITLGDIIGEDEIHENDIIGLITTPINLQAYGANGEIRVQTGGSLAIDGTYEANKRIELVSDGDINITGALQGVAGGNVQEVFMQALGNAVNNYLPYRSGDVASEVNFDTGFIDFQDGTVKAEDLLHLESRRSVLADTLEIDLTGEDAELVIITQDDLILDGDVDLKANGKIHLESLGGELVVNGNYQGYDDSLEEFVAIGYDDLTVTALPLPIR